ncbi:2-oxoglutarate dehydrogenase E1 component [Candidatus Sumerlaeota bacterium]|nr:2-oxoglutarate dehydrogenase E1 component [Candidatus Sumerlaeota bacterium]
MNAWAPEYLESQYEQWKADPASVGSQWQSFFQGFDLAASQTDAPSAAVAAAPANDAFIDKNGRVNSLVYHYRDVGHLAANLDPLGIKRASPEMLTLDFHGLSEADLDTKFRTGVREFTNGSATLRDIIAYLQSIYCGTMGVEYMHIQNTGERRWLQERLEKSTIKPAISPDGKRGLLRKLLQAEMFENFLHTRYKGEKRFSLEGGETLIPILWYALESAGELEAKEVVVGMAHRGRLNVLANIINKSYDEIFSEFEGNYDNLGDGGGDVKYHKGYSSNFITSTGNFIKLTLTANPSHLEAVDPVVEGRTRAKQRLLKDTERKLVLPFLIHGDAAFAGQGIVAEMFNMMTLPGYTTGGTIHFIVNNQIGFTTDPADARSTPYCTDVAKMVQSPIFHVNSEDPEMCANVVKIALEYRQRFRKDVVIDMWCYRKYGHNEGDEPAYTQPRMYEVIRTKKPISSIYQEKLREENIVGGDDVELMRSDLEQTLNDAQQYGKENKVRKNLTPFRTQWSGFEREFNFSPVDTTFDEKVLDEIARKLVDFPEGFMVNPKLQRQLTARRDLVLNREALDWGLVENLAYGTLLLEETPVRLSGQDCRRGTFTHRHAALTDFNTEEDFIPLNFIRPGNQERFCVYDSPLSEASVLGFEYGYSLGDPRMLIIWEAQFGDFANGAQVIIDQFIASAETKWERSSGLVFLLPHGYEGQGPEHSSARLERFLQLCAENNMQVCNLTTPAQLFHAFRKQMKQKFRKPLIIMSPKSLLRHPKAVSTVEELCKGRFQEIIDDAQVSDPSKVRRILLHTGKIHYDLMARRAEVDRKDTALIRIEQIYPLHTELLRKVIARYPKANEFYWVQEEPRNMGAWSHIRESLFEQAGITVEYIGRKASATPAVGSKKAHDVEQAQLVEAALPGVVAKVAVG